VSDVSKCGCSGALFVDRQEKMLFVLGGFLLSIEFRSMLQVGILR
jgi:hypothetical protein